MTRASAQATVFVLDVIRGRAVGRSQRALSCRGGTELVSVVPPPFGSASLPPSRSPLGGRGSCRAVPPLGARVSRRAGQPWEGEAPAEPQDSIAMQAVRLSRSFALPEGRGSRRIERAKGQTSSSAQQELRPPGGPQHNRDCEREAPAEPQDFTTRRAVQLSRRFALTVVPRPSRVSSDPAAQRIPGSAGSQTP